MSIPSPEYPILRAVAKRIFKAQNKRGRNKSRKGKQKVNTNTPSVRLSLVPTTSTASVAQLEIVEPMPVMVVTREDEQIDLVRKREFGPISSSILDIFEDIGDLSSNSLMRVQQDAQPTHKKQKSFGDSFLVDQLDHISTPSEEQHAFATALIDSFQKGILDLPDGTELVAYLSKKLLCERSLLEQKLSETSSISTFTQIYKRSYTEEAQVGVLQDLEICFLRKRLAQQKLVSKLNLAEATKKDVSVMLDFCLQAGMGHMKSTVFSLELVNTHNISTVKKMKKIAEAGCLGDILKKVGMDSFEIQLIFDEARQFVLNSIGSESGRFGAGYPLFDSELCQVFAEQMERNEEKRSDIVYRRGEEDTLNLDLDF